MEQFQYLYRFGQNHHVIYEVDAICHFIMFLVDSSDPSVNEFR